MKLTNTYGFNHIRAYEYLVVEKIKIGEYSILGAFRKNELTKAMRMADGRKAIAIENPKYSDLENFKVFGCY